MSSRSSVSSSTGKGASHWWRQRFTAIFLFLLAPFAMFGLILNIGQPYEEVIDHLSNPLSVSITSLFLLFLFYHATLGLQIIIRDYITDNFMSLICTVVMKIICVFAATLGIVSLLSLLS